MAVESGHDLVVMAPPDLLLLHGFTHTGASWDPVIAELRERYRATAPDIRGHGAASARRPVTLEAVLADLAAVPSARFTLAGYSMGGRIALHFALAHPQRVARLVLIGASPGIADPGERAARRAQDEALADRVQRMSASQFADEWARTPVLADQAPEVREAARIDRLRSQPSGLAAALRGLGAGALEPLWQRLPELAMPVTLIAGERDRKFAAIAHEMAAPLRDPRVEIVPGAGHAVHLECPRAVASILAGR
jgi:2-succinyl-6-hydroxy-2,4-cyclohexadiene-1-carboxylate synthase